MFLDAHSMAEGIDYLVSEEKRTFDKRMVSALRFLPTMARLGAKATFGYEIYKDERVGQYGDVYVTPKIKTLHDDTNEPINAFARMFRVLGLDETVQIDEIVNGTLSVIGRRRLVPDEYERLRELAGQTLKGRALLSEWDDVVLPYPCGLISSYGIEGREHGSESVERRLQLDVEDSILASRRHDTALVITVLRNLTTGKLRHASLPIEPES